MSVRAILFDLDGTLIDSNDAHADVWVEVFRDAGHDVPRDRVRGQIGKGGDLLVPTLLPDLPDDEAKTLEEAHGRVFKRDHLAAMRPFPHARNLLVRARAAGASVVLASSAGQEELDHYVDLLDAADLVDATTSSDDVDTSKPAPDIVAAALDKAGVAAGDAIMVGDTPFDIESAGRAGVAVVALRSGGFDDAALAGAAAIYDDVAALLANYDASPLAG